MTIILKMIQIFQPAAIRLQRVIFSQTNLKKISRSTIAVAFAHCVSKKEADKSQLQYIDPSQLTHKHLIQQSCTQTVNSASQLLTCTLVALVDVGQKYREALEEQLKLMEESLNNIENSALQDELTDLVTAARSDVATFKKSFMELVSLMDYVEKLVDSTTETSFLAGAEAACLALSERLNSAKIVINEQLQLNKKLEDELVLLHQTIIRQSGKRKDKKS